MTFDRLDLNLLVCLDALLSTRSVTAAAEQLRVGQPAMSAALGRLRTYFGDELLVYVGGKMEPTALGRSLKDPVRNALQLIRATITGRTEFDPASSQRTFSIVMSDFAGEILLPPLLARLDEEAPGVVISVTSPPDFNPVMLERGEVDLAITLEPYLSPNNPMSLLFEDEYAVIAWSGNTKISDTLTAEEYFAARHVINSFGEKQMFLDSYLDVRGRRKPAAVCRSFSMVPRLIVGSDRLATLLRRHAEIFSALMPLRVFPVPVEVPKAREMMQWHQSSRDDPGIVWIRGCLETVAREFA